MHAKIQITNLTVGQFDQLDQLLRTSYEFPREDMTRVCAVFQVAGNCCSALGERHVELPAAELDQVLYLLELVGRGAEIRRLPDGRLVAVDPQIAAKPR